MPRVHIAFKNGRVTARGSAACRTLLRMVSPAATATLEKCDFGGAEARVMAVFASEPKVFVLHPGEVRMVKDGHVHYVGMQALRRLYNLDRWPDARISRADGAPFKAPYPINAIHLYPQPSSNYALEL